MRTILLALVLWVMVPGLSWGQKFDVAHCATLDVIYATLWREHQERGLDVFTESDGKTMIFFGNERTRTWTMVQVMPDTMHVGCIIRVGTFFARYPYDQPQANYG